MSYIDINDNGGMETPLQQMLLADNIEPGSEPSYQICKTIYEYHPLGKRLIDTPLDIAMSKPREITIQDSPENSVAEAFEKMWKLMNADTHIKNTARLAGIYGAATLSYDVDAINPITQNDYEKSDVIPPDELHKLVPIFHEFDPLNTAGSLVLEQNPLSKNFQRPVGVTVAGVKIHPSRCCVIMNEQPIYISYTGSSYGYVGRSKYQRALYPLKSFIQSMITDDLVQEKAGLLVAKMRQPSSIVDKLMQKAADVKRQLLKNARSGNVFSLDLDESVESINLTQISEPMTVSRNNIIENIALAADVPASMLTGDSFAKGLNEGGEDAKKEMRYIDTVRESMNGLYAFMDKICMRLAWTPEFYDNIVQKFQNDYGGMTFDAAFYKWSNSFEAKWPDLIEEREETRLKAEEIRLKGSEIVLDKMAPMLDPVNRAALIAWVADNINELKITFPNKLEIDEEALAAYVPPEPIEQSTDNVY